MNCPKCNNDDIQKDGNHNGMQRYKCLNCKKRFDYGNYGTINEYIIHFNVKIRKNFNNKLTRDNYCIPSNELDYKDKKNLRIADEFYKKNNRYPTLCPSWFCNIPNDIYKDFDHYTDEYVESHYKDCMKNYDLNMNFFSSINHDDFEKYLLKFTEKNSFIEIKDLNILKDKNGIYIIVLDNYNQVYIGKSDSHTGMKNRIMSHWSKKKEFGRLLCGSIENSILSIDSFGAIDTTRIFYKEIKWPQDIDKYEEKIVGKFKQSYRLNRVYGGINTEQNLTIRNLKLMLSVQTRKL